MDGRAGGQRQIVTQIYRQADRQANRRGSRQAGRRRQAGRKSQRQTNRHANRLIDRQAEADTQTGRYIDKNAQAGRQTDKRGRNIHTIFVSSHKTYTVRHVAHRKMPQLPRRSIDQNVAIDVGCRARRASRSVAPSATRTETMYQEMKTTYGTNSCHLLQINSRHPSVAHQMDSSDELVGTLPDPWAQFLPRKSASMVRSPGEQ